MATITKFSNEITIPGIPKALKRKAVVDAVQIFCQDTWCLRAGVSVEFDAADVDSTDEYVEIDLGEFGDDLEPIAFLDFKVDGGDADLQPSPSGFYGLYADIAVFADGEPAAMAAGNMYFGSPTSVKVEKKATKYFNFPDSTTLRIYAFDAQDFELYVNMAFKPADGVESVDDFFWMWWRKAIIEKTKELLRGMDDRPWSDDKKEFKAMRKYNGLMGEARIQLSRQFIGRTQTVQTRGIV